MTTPVILSVAAFLTTAGFAAWILGSLFGYTEVAVLGGIMVVGVGAMVTANGLDYKTGEVEEATGANVTTTSFQYDSVETPEQMPLGILLSILGGMLVMRAMNPEQGLT